MIQASAKSELQSITYKHQVGVPTVDVVIPCYNYGHYLSNCVQSVLAQEGVNVRVLIIDDASPDRTPEVGKALATEHACVEFIRHETNKGHIATYNEGLLEWSSGDYVVLLSADDILAPQAFVRAMEVMESDKSIGMVYGRTFHFHEEKQLAALPTDKPVTKFDRYPGTVWLDKRFRAGYNVITSPEVVVRGTVHRAVGGYRRELPHSGDLEIWLRIAAVSDIAFLHHTQAYYRVHPSSMQRTKYKSSFVDLVHRKAAFDSFIQHHSSISFLASLQHSVNRALASEALWDACRAFDRDRLDTVNIEELLQFAISTYKESESLPEFSALRRRQRLGAIFCHRTQIFAIPASFRWLDRRLKKARLLRHGI